MIKVIIVDDHEIMRRGLQLILASAEDIQVMAEAENGAAALKLLERQVPDVLLLDVAMPELGGHEVLQHIAKNHPELAVLVLSMYPEEQYALRLIKAGAAGYMTKDSAPTQLVAAIRQVASGKKYISPRVAELMADSLQHGGDEEPHNRLSTREFQVLCRIASGRTPTQIADEMELSVRTVSTYRARILAKMHMTTSAELTHYAIKHELV